VHIYELVRGGHEKGKVSPHIIWERVAGHELRKARSVHI